MNRYYSYENIEFWDEKMWEDKVTKTFPLVQWLGNNTSADKTPYHDPIDGLYGEDVKTSPYYHKKTNSVNPPELIKYWEERGITYGYRAQGVLAWLFMVPTEAFKTPKKKLKTLVVMNNVDILDPYWNLKTMDKFREYNDMLKKEKDLIILYLAREGPDYVGTYINVMQEAFVMLPCDPDRVYLDISPVYNCGKKLSDIEEFSYIDRSGDPVDADTQVINIGYLNIPALDISRRWTNSFSLGRDQLTSETWSSKSFNKEKLIHSGSGRLLAEGFALEHRFSDVYDPGFKEYFKNMGLNYESYEYNGEHWKLAVPMSAYDEPEKLLPAVCVLQEVNEINEHLAVTEASYFLEYFRIAAQGECILINFVLEDEDSNDILTEIIEEAVKLCPMIDRTRIYLSGHSHNGYFSVEFATRHPQLIAAVATYGNNPGLQPDGNIPIPDEKVERMRSIDMPLVNACGYVENNLFYPMNKDGSDYRPGQGLGPRPVTFEQRAETWQRRLRASNCPMRSYDEIADTRNSDNYAIRKLGIPGEKGDTLWLDGSEIYIVDIKNNDGKYHLRMIGEENMPHNTTPNQEKLCWSFMRRFARDLETGKTIELY